MTELEVAPSLSYDLNDRYHPGAGPALLTGVQAIARLLVEQHLADLRCGRRVATFVSGYQGSPLGGVDKLLAGMPEVLTEHDIVFVPGLNEELAATAVFGSQAQLPAGNPTHDGVVGVWYGKGPGLDRAVDALRHANHYGVNAHGGMLLLVGDDPGSKSSSLPVTSERTLAAMNIPVLYPRDASEIVTLGLHAIALSRASGCVVAMKIVADVADGTSIVPGDVGQITARTPEITWNGAPFRYLQRPIAAPVDSVIAEADLFGPRRAMVDAFSGANQVDAIDTAPVHARIGIVAAGATFDAVRQCLLDLGLDREKLDELGVRLLRLGLIYPMARSTASRFAAGLQQIVVVEEKAAFLEAQLREILYGGADVPVVVGKTDTIGKSLVPADGELTAGRLQEPLHRILRDHVPVRRPLPAPLALEVLVPNRTPYFCSGCPHNRSTVIPEGSLAGGGIGCHTLVTMSGRADTTVTGLTQMGGEGAQWIGQAPFTDIGHLFQNIGDGTYFHSGQLAVQACVAAGVNITYKVLFNEVVAMTGAQTAEGALTVAALTHKLIREGVAGIIVCADDPARHRRRDLARGTRLWHRDRLDEAQRKLREVPGVTVLIYDQHCAADARRLRKRSELPERRTRVVINERVCEGCGDCGVKSNCLSVQPVTTEFGRKTRIDQSSCNVDYSCLDGDCPSFITVELSDAPKVKRKPRFSAPPTLPDRVVETPTRVHNVLLAGIGGTGIVTVNQVLATAAMTAGLQVSGLDQTGLSQKAGPVISHLRIGPDIAPSNRLSPASADCLLAFDLLTALDAKNIGYLSATRTVAVISTSTTPTGEMIYDKATTHPESTDLLAALRSKARRAEHIDALAAAATLFGDSVYGNILLVGMAYESGALPIPAEHIESAITLNNVSVAANIAAFRWGRVAVAQPRVFAAAVAPLGAAANRSIEAESLLRETTLPPELQATVQLFAGELIAFQNIALARRYVDLVERTHHAERRVAEAITLTEAVARGSYRFMAYKDEYEVARLLTDPLFLEEINRQVPGAVRAKYRLHPPVLRALGMRNKIAVGRGARVIFMLLAKGAILRGTWLDPFGHTAIRKLERALRDHYAETIEALITDLDPDSYATAIAVAEAASIVCGYEEVKTASVARYLDTLATLGVGPGLLKPS